MVSRLLRTDDDVDSGTEIMDIPAPTDNIDSGTDGTDQSDESTVDADLGTETTAPVDEVNDDPDSDTEDVDMDDESDEDLTMKKLPARHKLVVGILAERNDVTFGRPLFGDVVTHPRTGPVEVMFHRDPQMEVLDKGKLDRNFDLLLDFTSF